MCLKKKTVRERDRHPDRKHFSPSEPTPCPAQNPVSPLDIVLRHFVSLQFLFYVCVWWGIFSFTSTLTRNGILFILLYIYFLFLKKNKTKKHPYIPKSAPGVCPGADGGRAGLNTALPGTGNCLKFFSPRGTPPRTSPFCFSHTIGVKNTQQPPSLKRTRPVCVCGPVVHKPDPEGDSGQTDHPGPGTRVRQDQAAE